MQNIYCFSFEAPATPALTIARANVYQAGLSACSVLTTTGSQRRLRLARDLSAAYATLHNAPFGPGRAAKITKYASV
jgi:hypothetical protein